MWDDYPENDAPMAKTLTIYLPPELRQHVESLAAADKRSLGQWIRLQIERSIGEAKRKDKRTAAKGPRSHDYDGDLRGAGQ